VSDYQTFQTIRWCLHCPQVMTGNFLLLLPHLSCTTNQRGIPFGYLLHLLVQGHQHLVLCSLEYLQFLPGDHNSDNLGVFIAEEDHAAQDKGSGYKTTVDSTLGGLFHHVPGICLNCQSITASRVSASDYRSSTACS